MVIVDIETILLNMAYLDAIAPHIARSSLSQSKGQATLYRVELEDGTVGYGDAMGAPTDVSAFVGRNAVAGLSDIKHGGVQMACYDAVGKTLGLPAHALMGRQVRQQVPFAYWTIDLPPDVFAQQAKYAVSLGYQMYKFKCRPWWDPIEQMEQVAAAVPDGISLWLDFNGHLREVRQALPVLKALSQFDCVGGFESPIPQRDVAGYHELRQKVDRPIAAHYGSGCCHVRSDPAFDRGVPATEQIAQRLCDGFVLGAADVEVIRQRASVADEARIPFWIQTVGTGLRAAWVAHLASTFKQGVLAHLAAHTLWKQDVIGPLEPVAGWLQVPEGSGLGVAIDEDAVVALRDASLEVETLRISTAVYPDGRQWHFADDLQRQEAFYFGNLPGFVRGIRLDVREDDGSEDFKALYSKCIKAPVMTHA